MLAAALVCTPAGSCIVAGGGAIKHIFAGRLPIVARAPNLEGRLYGTTLSPVRSANTISHDLAAAVFRYRLTVSFLYILTIFSRGYEHLTDRGNQTE